MIINCRKSLFIVVMRYAGPAHTSDTDFQAEITTYMKLF